MIRCPSLFYLITSTTFLTLFGSPGNGLLFCEAIRNDSHKSMRDPRAFIVTKKEISTSPLDISLLSRGGTVSRGVSPRLEGGASDRADVAKKATKIGLIDWIQNIPRAKLGWAISFVINLVYLAVLISPKESCEFSQEGFCILNYDGETCPINDNSHLYAWRNDVIFTILTLIVGTLLKTNFSMLIAIAFSIFSHGLLHKVLSNNQCQAFSVGYSLYAAFTAFILYFTLDGFGTFETLTNTIVTALLTAVTVWIAMIGKGVAGIFLTTQLLGSAIGSFFPKEGLITQLTGDLFVLPCITSLVEALYCCNEGGEPGWFNKVGGHFWYDFFLSIVIVSSLFPEKEKYE